MSKVEDVARNHTLLTHEEEIALAKRVETGDLEARNELVTHNIRLVYKIVDKYAAGLKDGMEFSDLVQEGCIGLMHAADMYDWRMGFRFSTYAVNWIRQAITRAMENENSTIRVPSYLRQDMYQITKARDKYIKQSGRSPNTEEIAVETGFDKERIKFVLDANDKLTTASLDAPMPRADHPDATLMDFLMDDAQTPEEVLIDSDLNDEIMKLLQILPEREQYILEQRYGLTTGEPKTLEEVGDVLGITRERVRQLELKAINKIRAAAYRHGLRDYV